MVPGSSAFSPRHVSGLALWLDADDAATLTVDGSSNVTAWRDKARGLSFTVAAGANAPALSTVDVGGASAARAAVLFDDANAEALEVAEAVVTATPVSVFVVASSDAVTAFQNTFGVFASGDALNYLAVCQFRGTTANDPIFCPAIGTAGGGSTAVLAGPYVSGESYLVSGVDAGTSRSGWLDGAEGTGNSTTRTPASLDQTVIGRFGGTTDLLYHSGKIMAVLVYDRALSTAEREAVEDYLWRRWINPATAVGGSKAA